jgi:hypothetical protein
MNGYGISWIWFCVPVSFLFCSTKNHTFFTGTTEQNAICVCMCVCTHIYVWVYTYAYVVTSFQTLISVILHHNIFEDVIS